MDEHAVSPSLSPSQKRYLIASYAFGKDGAGVRSRDIAEFLGVKHPSVSRMLQSLAESGMIEKEYYGTVRFTGRGVRTAAALYAEYLFLTGYFRERFLFSESAAENDAVACLCRLSQEGVGRLTESAVRHFKKGPS